MNRKLKITFYLAAIFVTGVVTGMFISKLIVQHMMPSREKMVDHWCGDLRSKLDLTPEQMQKIRPIIEKDMTDFKDDLCRQMVANLASCNAQIAAELTPVQKVKLDQLQKEQEEFIRSKFGGETSASLKTP
jgi:Spy/CpxP family protein refolding chaperone